MLECYPLDFQRFFGSQIQFQFNSQLSGYSTGPPTSVRVAVVVIEI